MQNQESKYTKLIKTAYMIGQIGEEFFDLTQEELRDCVGNSADADIVTYAKFKSEIDTLSVQDLTELLIEGITTVDRFTLDASGKSALCSYIAQSSNFKHIVEKESISEKIEDGLKGVLINMSKEEGHVFCEGLKIFVEEIGLENSQQNTLPEMSETETTTRVTEEGRHPSSNPIPSKTLLSRLFGCFFKDNSRDAR
jgi:hypothetical protein